jgi:dihydrofolate reductase
MRKVLLQMGLSVDGIVAGGPPGAGEAGSTQEDEAVRNWKVNSLRDVGTHIMGRVTYEQMAGHWPYNGPAEYADAMNNIPKVVFSKTLTKAEWKESRIAGGDLSEEIARLKSEPGKDIMAHGGASFVQALSREGLIDEYRLVISPVALGSGMPLFKDLLAPLRLRLVESNSFTGGTVISVYEAFRNL